jgi:superfamily II DNA or RNA helicase
MTDPSGALRFTELDVRRSLRPEVVARGQVYAAQGRVTGLEISSLDGSISAHVRGSAAVPYAVSILMSKARDGRTLIVGQCDCPIGYDCKHVAAVLFAAFAERDAAQIIRAPQMASDPQLEFWLTRMRETLEPTSVAATTGDERIAYVFRIGARVTYSRTFPVDLVVVRLSKAERWTRVRDMSFEALVSGSARATGAQDAILGRFLRAYESTYKGRADFAEDIVRRIVATGHAHLERIDAPVLTLGPTRPSRIDWMLADDGTQRPHLIFEDDEMRLLSAAVPWYVNVRTGETGPLDASLPGSALLELLTAPPLKAAQAKRVRETFAHGMHGVAIPAPLEIVERTIRVKPIPTLILRTVDLPATSSRDWRGIVPAQTIDIAEFTFGYGDVIVDPASNADDVRRVVNGEAVTFVRSPEAETRAAQRLQAFGLVKDHYLRDRVDARGLLLRFEPRDAPQWPVFAHRAPADLRAEGWRVEIDPTFRHKVVDLAGDDAWHTQIVESDSGWFDVAIGLDVGERRIQLLPLLRDVFQQSDLLRDPTYLDNMPPDQSYYVSFGDGTTLAFPVARLKAILATFVELGDPTSLESNGSLRLPRARAAVVSGLDSASDLRWDVPARTRELGERLRAFAGVERVQVPASFRGELRPYQRDGLDWLQFLSSFDFGGILADDMGLGKSVQTLAHLLCEKEAGRLTQPVLLVVPTSIVYNWCDEAARFAPTLRVLPLHGSARSQRFGEIAQHDLVITTYALLLRDTLLREREWHAVILDEAQALKNPQAKAAQIAMGLRTAHRLCLTGTPVENHLGDLWSLFSIALPGALGDRKQFARLFRAPIEKKGDAVRGRLLAERIRPFLLRRTKEAVASELPEKTEIVQRVELVGAQRDLYETIRVTMQRRVRDEIAQHGLARSQIIILDALLKLRQVCCDPRLLPVGLRKTAESVKLDLLLEILPQLIEEGRRVLLFSQFTSMLDLIAPALKAREIPFVMLTGKTTNRASVVKRFQSREVPVFLISLKAGGTGLNLTAADTVIHYDPWWNPAVERQATDRAHRIGQTQHVFVYKFIGAGTVEEKIVELQTRKAALAAAIFSEKGAAEARFSVEDVERLFAPLETG